jgi:hypothetical protein
LGADKINFIHPRSKEVRIPEEKERKRKEINNNND